MLPIIPYRCLQSLPIECVDIILGHLGPDHRVQTLFTLLTVSKFLFHASVRHLYADPMKTLLRHKDDPNSFAAEKLLILVLRYSPAQDADVLDLRLMFSDELAKLPLIPTTNYLAHIKTMSFCMELFGTYSNLAQKARASFPCDRRVYNLRLYATLVWAACGHQLAKIQDIHIPCRDIARYFAHIPKMARMRSIRLFLHDVADPSLRSWKPIEIESVRLDLEATFNFVALWKTKTAATARQECNNNNSNNNGIITDKKLYTDLRLVWSGEATFEWPLDPFSGDLLRIFHQMPLLRTSKITCRERLQWARFQLAPETIDLSNVSTIEARVEGKQHWSWPQEGITSVLYQCRGLRCLELSLQDGDENIFAWVVNQKRKADVSHHPLRRLEELTLDIRGTGSWVQDALTAFGSQLKVLNITSWSNYSLDLALINGLCELRELHVDVGKMVNSGNVRPFSGCPCLWRIQLAHSVFNDKSLDLFDLSAVTDLTLRGPSAVQFQQSSLSSMVKARRIVVQVDQRRDLDEVPLPFYWERTCWSLPSLQELVITGWPALTFDWRILNCCPSLHTLCLMSHSSAGPYGISLPLHIYNGDQSTAFTALRSLELVGWELIGKIMYDSLPRMLPNLESLSLKECVRVNRVHRKRLRASFPKLTRLTWS